MNWKGSDQFTRRMKWLTHRMNQSDSALLPISTITFLACNGPEQPRALDVDIGLRLGMAQPLNIRQTIEKHRDELEQFGMVHAAREPYVSGRGRIEEATAYYLTEEQALTLALISRAPRARDVRAMLVRVFVAHRRRVQPFSTSRRQFRCG